MKKWLTLQTILFEVSGIYLLLAPSPPSNVWFYFALSHTVASVSFSALCWLVLPRHYKKPLLPTISFLFLFNLLMPVIGIIGTCFSLLIALYLPRKAPLVTWKECERAQLPLNPGESIGQRFGTGALREILVHSDNDEKRLIAVNAIRNMSQQQAVPLLQLALRDLSDDIRLMAYASLEAIENEINGGLSRLQAQYNQKPTAQVALDIAQQYWELCYLGIADGSLKRHYLQQAKTFILHSIKLNSSASAHLLLGRVLLDQNDPTAAQSALETALSGGLLSSQVAPYLAEVAFINKDYETMRHHLQYFPEQQGTKLSQIREYWA